MPRTRKITGRKYACALLPLAGVIGIALATLPGPAARAADPIELKVGVSAFGNTSLSLLMAQDAGFFAERGLKVDMTAYDAGSRGAAEVQAGRLDAMHVGLSAVIALDRAGADLRLIASLVDVARFSLYVAPGVTSAADLKGGVMAISGFGSESDSTMMLALSRLGLTRNDVVFKETNGNASRIAGIKSGEFKGAMLAEPSAAAARQQGLRPMVDLAAERIPWVYSALVVRGSDLTQRRDVVKRFLQATVEGAYLGLTNEARAKTVLARDGKITDPAIVAAGYAEFKSETPPLLEPTREQAVNVLAQFPGGSNRIEDYVDAGLIHELAQEGFFAGMERKYGKP
jgi:ABC-type nitrate/sulfonate/bicarbonate transport system substrate-binding protein